MKMRKGEGGRGRVREVEGEERGEKREGEGEGGREGRKERVGEEEMFKGIWQHL